MCVCLRARARAYSPCVLLVGSFLFVFSFVVVGFCFVVGVLLFILFFACLVGWLVGCFVFCFVFSQSEMLIVSFDGRHTDNRWGRGAGGGNEHVVF